MIGQVLGEVLLGDAADITAREFDDRRAWTQIEEHRGGTELQIQVEEHDGPAVGGEGRRDVGRERGRANTALAMRERDDDAELAWRRCHLGYDTCLPQDRLDLRGEDRQVDRL